MTYIVQERADGLSNRLQGVGKEKFNPRLVRSEAPKIHKIFIMEYICLEIRQVQDTSVLLCTSKSSYLRGAVIIEHF